MSKSLVVPGGRKISVRQARREGAYIKYWINPNDREEYPTRKNGGWSSFKETRTFEKALKYARSLQGGATIERILCLPDRCKGAEYPLKERWCIRCWDYIP